MPAIVKRKIGASEHGESEESSDEKNKTGKEEEKGTKRSIERKQEQRRARAQDRAWTLATPTWQERLEQHV